MRNFTILKLLSILCLLGFSISGNSQAIGDENYPQELAIAVDDSITISGTLSRPAKKDDRNRLLIMVSPPKRYDRDMIANKVKFFRYLADVFVQRGYSVFRFDNRGIGKSTGSNKAVTLYTHAKDVKGICDFFLGSEDFSRMEIGLLGISEGGSSAIIVAAEIPQVSCLLLLSTPANFGWGGFNYQLKKHFEGRGALFGLHKYADSLYKEEVKFTRPLFSIMETYKSSDMLEKNVKKYVLQHILSKDPKAKEKATFNEYFNNLTFQWINPHQVAMKTFDARPFLAKINCPVLALCGTIDRKVQCHTQLNAIKDALKTNGNQGVTIVPLKNVDHSYQTWTDSSFMERLDQNEKISIDAINTMLSWLGTLSASGGP